MNEQDDLMGSITAALETAPIVRVPDDFAARVMARVPQRVTRRLAVPILPRARYGRYAVAAAIAVLLVATLVFAPATRNSLLWISLQTMLFAQLGALVIWFGWLRRV